MTMTKTAVIYDPLYLEHYTGVGHPESPQRLTAIMNGIKRIRLLETGKCVLLAPKAISSEALEAVHDPSYSKAIERISRSGGGAVDSDTILSAKSYDAAIHAAGGMLDACELVLAGKFSNAFALVRPPGHHAGTHGRALSASSQGFCVFNNVAITAANLIEKHGLERVMILDIDVHHGNGTQEIFNPTSKVLYISIHQDGRTLYPGTGFVDEIGEGEGEGSKVNIPLPPYSGDEIYLKVLKQIVIPIATEYRPEMILISAGFDAHHTDPVASMRLSSMGYLEMFEATLSLASKLCSGKLAAVLEGGYNLDTLSKLVPGVIAKMAQVPFSITDKRLSSSSDTTKLVGQVIKQVKTTLAPYWSFNLKDIRNRCNNSTN
jgi:acetoin utilization deacetylase AcuC-like enzyme